MKKLVLAIALFAATPAVFAQNSNKASTVATSPYEKTMAEKISKIAECKTPEEFSALANDFARIGAKETDKWLPNYYAALATIQKGRVLMRSGKTEELDNVADDAQKYLAVSEKISPENAENFILEKMIHSLRMMVNPQQRFMSEGALAAEALSKAEKLEAQNPRITLLKAEDTYFTPEQFGGSKERGTEFFKKALAQFVAYKPATALSPNWGKSEAQFFLSQK